MEKMIETAVIWALPLLLAITLHEAAHAYVARFLGDSTAYLAGRLTLDPLKHIDVLGTVIIPVALLLVGSPFIFGYAKPVPVDFGQVRHPRRGTALVALAGPAANLLMAFLWSIVKVGLIAGHVHAAFLHQMADAGIVVTLLLFAFNLFPLPPLD